MITDDAEFTVTAKRQRTPVVHTEEFFTEPRPWGAQADGSTPFQLPRHRLRALRFRLLHHFA